MGGPLLEEEVTVDDICLSSLIGGMRRGADSLSAACRYTCRTRLVVTDIGHSVANNSIVVNKSTETNGLVQNKLVFDSFDVVGFTCWQLVPAILVINLLRNTTLPWFALYKLIRR